MTKQFFNKHKIYLPVLFFLFLAISHWLISANTLHAADAYILETPLTDGQTSVNGPAQYTRIFFIFGLGLVGIIALFAIVFGGIRYAISGSSETGKTEGKKWIIGALSGIVLLFSSYLILRTINPDLVSLKEPYLEMITIPTGPESYDSSSPADTKTPAQIGKISSSLEGLKNYIGQIDPTNTKIIISKSNHTLSIYKDGELIGQAPIGIGSNDPNGEKIGGTVDDKITPVGDFVINYKKDDAPGGIISKEFNTNMGPAILNVDVSRGIHIHGSGTDNIRDTTAGCIKVHNADVTLLYQAIPAGTPVQIRN